MVDSIFRDTCKSPLNNFLVKWFNTSDFIFLLILDHALQNHVIGTALVLDEFECQLSCLSNETCQSFNVHPNRRARTRICELNNATNQKNPEDFKWKKGSSYYGSVKVG